MVATDTVVGIVGAVVLVAVMAGVFIYEYNQAQDEGSGGSTDFLAAYPFLDPAGDIDGDGVANADDDDLDGDGIANADDTDLVVTFTANMTIGRAPDRAELMFTVGAGNLGATATATFSTLLPSPAPPQPSLSVGVAAGDQTWPGDVSYSGTAATATVAVEEVLPAGSAVFFVETDPASLAEAPLTMTVTVLYG